MAWRRASDRVRWRYCPGWALTSVREPGGLRECVCVWLLCGVCVLGTYHTCMRATDAQVRVCVFMSVCVCVQYECACVCMCVQYVCVCAAGLGQAA